jgi:hypothetical protein
MSFFFFILVGAIYCSQHRRKPLVSVLCARLSIEPMLLISAKLLCVIIVTSISTAKARIHGMAEVSGLT